MLRTFMCHTQSTRSNSAMIQLYFQHEYLKYLVAVSLHDQRPSSTSAFTELVIVDHVTINRNSSSIHVKYVCPVSSTPVKAIRILFLRVYNLTLIIKSGFRLSTS